jgi:hypothetical protein
VNSTTVSLRLNFSALNRKGMRLFGDYLLRQAQRVRLTGWAPPLVASSSRIVVEERFLELLFGRRR